jgi:hypothetical protein
MCSTWNCVHNSIEERVDWTVGVTGEQSAQHEKPGDWLSCVSYGGRRMNSSQGHDNAFRGP